MLPAPAADMAPGAVTAAIDDALFRRRGRKVWAPWWFHDGSSPHVTLGTSQVECHVAARPLPHHLSVTLSRLGADAGMTGLEVVDEGALNTAGERHGHAARSLPDQAHSMRHERMFCTEGWQYEFGVAPYHDDLTARAVLLAGEVEVSELSDALLAEGVAAECSP